MEIVFEGQAENSVKAEVKDLFTVSEGFAEFYEEGYGVADRPAYKANRPLKRRLC